MEYTTELEKIETDPWHPSVYDIADPMTRTSGVRPTRCPRSSPATPSTTPTRASSSHRRSETRLDGKVVVVTGAARGQGEAEVAALRRRGCDGRRHRRPAVRRAATSTSRRRRVGRAGRRVRRARPTSTRWSTTPASPAASGCPHVTLEAWHQTFDINVTGPLLGIQALVPLMAPGVVDRQHLLGRGAVRARRGGVHRVASGRCAASPATASLELGRARHPGQRRDARPGRHAADGVGLAGLLRRGSGGDPAGPGRPRRRHRADDRLPAAPTTRRTSTAPRSSSTAASPRTCRTRASPTPPGRCREARRRSARAPRWSTTTRRTSCRPLRLHLVELGLERALEIGDQARTASRSRTTRPTCCCPTSRRASATSSPSSRTSRAYAAAIDDAVGVPEAWYDAPTFYFTNPHALYGPGEPIPGPPPAKRSTSSWRSAPSPVRTSTIFGYTILNDWSARDIQSREMQVGLGPAKGKDFATSFGPWIVTADEPPVLAVALPRPRLPGVRQRRADRPGPAVEHALDVPGDASPTPPATRS